MRTHTRLVATVAAVVGLLGGSTAGAATVTLTGGTLSVSIGALPPVTTASSASHPATHAGLAVPGLRRHRR